MNTIARKRDLDTMLNIDKLYCIDGSGSKDAALARQKTPIYEFTVDDRLIKRIFLDDDCTAFDFFSEQSEIAIEKKSNILIAADLPLGVPTNPADVYHNLPDQSFLSLLETLGERCQTSNWRTELIAESPSERSPAKPFVSVGGGAKVGEWAGKRRCDLISGGNSIYPVDNSQKQVGKAALQFWIEVLRPLREKFGERLRVWPFEDLNHAHVVVAECYPRICQEALYGKVVSKRNPVKVVEALNGLRLSEQSDITADQLVWMHAASSEDEFDMFSTAVALGRWFKEQVDPFAVPDAPNIGQIEGWMLGLPADAEVRPTRSKKSRKSREPTGKRHPCPIAECSYVFEGSRGGWDAHAGSQNKHPAWNPSVKDRAERIRLFRKQFPEFFED